MVSPAVRLIERSINAFLRATINAEVRRVQQETRPRLKPHIPHELVVPGASYAPWVDDVGFNEVYQVACDYSLVDKYRLYELYSLVQQVKAVAGTVLEVGVWRGGSSAVIQKALVASGQSGRDFFIADTFTGVVKAGSPHDSKYRGGEHSDTGVEMVHDLFTMAALPLPRILKGIFPDDHPEAFDGPICFLHSDVDTYESNRGVLAWALPRLAENAVVVFDDYGFWGCEGATDFCNELRRDEQLYFIHNLNGHAVFIRK